MDPAMMRKAQEQMANMSPAQMEMMQQQMANMDPATLQRMAASMGGAPPGVDMAAAARQMKNMSADDLKKAQNDMKNMSPSDMEAKSKQMTDQLKYARDCATRAKEEGNKLFRAGSNAAAVEKYTRAAESLKLDSTTEAQAVVKACYLNSAACLLKLERWDEAEDACDQVLEGESSNLKALFRRGQAFTGQGMKTEAIADLKAAMAVSAAEDPQIAAALLKAEALEEQPKQKEDRGFWEKRSIGELRKELTRRGVDCSQCTEKAELVDLVCSGERKKKKKKQPVVPSPAAQPQMNVSAEQMEQVQQQMKQNPAMMKEAAERMASMSDEEIARMGAMTGQKFDPAMAKTAASMMKNMSPEQMAQQMEMARQMQANQGGEGGLSAAADSLKGMSEEQLSGLNSTMAANGQPGITPEMASMAGDMMKNMSADDMKSMMEMSQNMQKGGQPSMADAAKMTEMMSKNPEMLKNITQSMQSMDPEQLQKMGISPDQAAKLGDTVQNMDPATLESMMKWGGRAAKVASPFVSGYQKVRSLDRQTMIHVLILVLAGLFIGHFTNSF